MHMCMTMGEGVVNVLTTIGKWAVNVLTAMEEEDQANVSLSMENIIIILHM